MKTSRRFRLKVPMLAVLLACTAGAAWSQSACERAWEDYRYFKERNTMEESQYPLTVHGAAVRAACGDDALPVPPGSDTPPPVRVRKPKPPPPKPDDKPAK